MTVARDPLIVLRFRDIGLAAGGTIREHRKAIGRYGMCWWGWLFREYEKNPCESLRTLIPEEGFSSTSVALYDTGRGRIYRTECTGVRTYRHPSRSPELDFTPGYYNNRPAPAWFKFTAIDEADEELVIGRTCIELPSASEECFTDLLGKPVNSLPDLRRQEVTMWVLS